MINLEHEVYFEEYCPTCENEKLDEHNDPCNDYLSNPTNENSHKPVHYKKKATIC